MTLDPGKKGQKGAKRGKSGQINGANWGKLMGQIARCNRPGSTIVNEDNAVDVRSEVRK